MNIDQSKINELRSLIEWVRLTTNKAANLEVSFWNHTAIEKQTIAYRIWIDKVFNKSSDDLDYLVYLIPTIKNFVYKIRIFRDEYSNGRMV